MWAAGPVSWSAPARYACARKLKSSPPAERDVYSELLLNQFRVGGGEFLALRTSSGMNYLDMVALAAIEMTVEVLPECLIGGFLLQEVM